MKAHYGCPIQATSNLISGKWKVLLLWHLWFQSYRFSELRDLLPGVSEKVLTAQLRELEQDGLVLRKSTNTVPARVDYSLSAAGEQLIPIMRSMGAWAKEHLGVLPAVPPQGASVRCLHSYRLSEPRRSLPAPVLP